MKLKQLKLATYTASSLVLGGLILAACSASESGGTIDNAYQGLGSRWSIEFSGENFTLTYDAESDGTVDMTAEGTFVSFETTKFRKLTVTSSSGVDAPAAGEQAYGLEIPGFAFFLKPLSENSEPIVMVKSGACPSSNFVANWIIAKYQEPTQTPKADEQDAFGTATFNLASDTATIVQYDFTDGRELQTNLISLIGCESGTMTFDDGDAGGTMYVTSNGGMLVNPGSGIIFAAPQLTADPAVSDLEGTYSGLLFSNNETTPAKVVLNSSGVGTGRAIDPETDDNADMSTVALEIDQVKSGLKGAIRGTIDSRPINCVMSSVDGEQLLACNGADGDAVSNVYPAFFFLGTRR